MQRGGVRMCCILPASLHLLSPRLSPRDLWGAMAALSLLLPNLMWIPPCYLITKLCLTLCDPMDFATPSLPDSSVHVIVQARILEWVSISFFTGSSWPRDQTRVPYVSFIGRRILYPWAIREAQLLIGANFNSEPHMKEPSRKWSSSLAKLTHYKLPWYFTARAERLYEKITLFCLSTYKNKKECLQNMYLKIMVRL